MALADIQADPDAVLDENTEKFEDDHTGDETPGLGTELQQQADDAAKARDKQPDPKADPKGTPPPADPLDAILEKKPGDKKADPLETKEPVNPADEFAKADEGVKSEKVRESIVNMRKRLGEQHQQLIESTRQIEELKKRTPAGESPEIKKRMEALEKENAEYRDAVVALNVEYDPKYQEKFVKGRSKLVDRAAQRAADAGGDAKAFKEALELKGQARVQAMRAALADVDEMERPRITAVLEQIQALDDERAEMQKDPQQAWEQMSRTRAEDQARRAKEADLMKTTAFEKVKLDLAESTPFLSLVDPQIKGGAEWNAAVKDAQERGMRMFDSDVPFESAARTAIKGADYDRVTTLLIDTRTQLKGALKKLAEYEGTTPAPRGTRPPPSKEKDDADEPLGTQLVRQAREREGGED